MRVPDPQRHQHRCSFTIANDELRCMFGKALVHHMSRHMAFQKTGMHSNRRVFKRLKRCYQRDLCARTTILMITPQNATRVWSCVNRTECHRHHVRVHCVLEVRGTPSECMHYTYKSYCQSLSATAGIWANWRINQYCNTFTVFQTSVYWGCNGVHRLGSSRTPT